MDTNEEQWLTGFTEGDGGIYLTHSQRYLRVFFGQKEREPLDYICSLLSGGNIYHSGATFRLEYNNRSYAYLVEVFARHVISTSFCERLNIILEFLKLPSTTLHIPTLDWFVGFWDAEGSSSNQVSIDLTQKERNVLDTVKTEFGGSISRNPNGGHQWRLSERGARKLAPEIERRSHNPQKLELLLSNLNSPTYRELHKEERATYDKTHSEEISAQHKRYYVKLKLLLEYIRRHPELKEEPG